MSPGRRFRIAAAMTALASYAACGDQPTEQAQPEPTTTTEAPNAEPDVVWIDDVDWHALRMAATTTTQRAARSRPRPAGQSSQTLPAGTGDVWARLAQCESGGNPRAVSSSGKFRGAFQFSLATWRSVGMSGDPIDHSYGEQLAAAQRLQARSGWGQWPACSRKLGLL